MWVYVSKGDIVIRCAIGALWILMGAYMLIDRYRNRKKSNTEINSVYKDLNDTKTLDEVIKALDMCINDGDAQNCFGCPYADCDGEAACFGDEREDALRYLQAYKEDKNDLTALRAYWAEQQENKPLTWDALKAMEGKPVWIEFLNDEGEWNGEWCLVESSDNILCEILRCKMSWWGLRKITLGKTWQAYKKERK